MGGMGNDTLYGHEGDDFLDGGRSLDGADNLHGGDGRDSIYYYHRLTGISVSLDGISNDGDTATIERDNVGPDIEVVVGGQGSDHLDARPLSTRVELYAEAGPDFLYGGSGDDELAGEDGVDLLLGGAGRDTLDGGPDNDQILAVDGEADSVDGGGGINSCTYDAVDTVSYCP